MCVNIHIVPFGMKKFVSQRDLILSAIADRLFTSSYTLECSEGLNSAYKGSMEDAHFSWGWGVICFPEVLRTSALHAALPEVGVLVFRFLIVSAPIQFLVQQSSWLQSSCSWPVLSLASQLHVL